MGAEEARRKEAAAKAEEEEDEDEDDSEGEEEEEEDNEPEMSLDDHAKVLQAWAENTKKLDRWISSRGGGLEPHLQEAPGKVVRLRDYMPPDVADSVLEILQKLPEEV